MEPETFEKAKKLIQEIAVTEKAVFAWTPNITSIPRTIPVMNDGGVGYDAPIDLVDPAVLREIALNLYKEKLRILKINLKAL